MSSILHLGNTWLLIFSFPGQEDRPRSEAFGAVSVRCAERCAPGCPGTTAGQDLNLSMDRVVGARNLTNKLWNAGKFLQMALDQAAPADAAAAAAADFSRPELLAELPLAERWILSSLHQVSALRLPSACDCYYRLRFSFNVCVEEAFKTKVLLL